MIKRTFECAKGHITEPFVRSDDDLEALKKANKLLCMECGDRIEKIHLPTTRVNSGVSRGTANQGNSPSPQEVKAELVRLRRAVEKECENVGDALAKEIRAGRDKVYGELTPKDRRELTEEGRPFHTIPWIEFDS
jgi:hypothetical protein